MLDSDWPVRLSRWAVPCAVCRVPPFTALPGRSPVPPHKACSQVARTPVRPNAKSRGLPTRLTGQTMLFRAFCSVCRPLTVRVRQPKTTTDGRTTTNVCTCWYTHETKSRLFPSAVMPSLAGADSQDCQASNVVTQRHTTVFAIPVQRLDALLESLKGLTAGASLSRH